jgi:hypothetical protein
MASRRTVFWDIAPAFQRNELPPSSRLKGNPGKNQPVSCLDYFSTLKIGAVISSETSGIHSVTSHGLVLLIVTAVRTKN